MKTLSKWRESLSTPEDAKDVTEFLRQQLEIFIDEELALLTRAQTRFMKGYVSKRVELPGLMDKEFFDKELRDIYEKRGWIIELSPSEHFSFVIFKFKLDEKAN